MFGCSVKIEEVFIVCLDCLKVNGWLMRSIHPATATRVALTDNGTSKRLSCNIAAHESRIRPKMGYANCKKQRKVRVFKVDYLLVFMVIARMILANRFDS
jgi:hypothetical protein